MLSEKKIACMYRGMIALRKLETHRKCERRMRKKVGADLGAEKFLNIKCRQAGLSPKAVVVVATRFRLGMSMLVQSSALGRC